MKATRAGLLSPSTTKSKKKNKGSSSNIKAIVLCILVLQNSALVLMLRYSRLVTTELYLPSTVVLLGELLKLIVSTVVLYSENGRSIRATQQQLFTYVFHRPMDIIKISVPALLYLVQNNLIFVAISNMDSATYQVLYQLKIFTTAIMSVLLLNKRLSMQHWLALVMLFVGVVMVQLSSSPTSSTGSNSVAGAGRSLSGSVLPQVTEESIMHAVVREQNAVLGFVAILIAVCCSGLSGVWFERILKTSKTSLWVRNFQLALVSFVLAVGSVIVKDFGAVRERGFFQGYSQLVVLLILTQAGGGLLVALVVKYADNILKGFACSLATLLSTFASMYLFAFEPSLMFSLGSVIVLAAVFYYLIVDGRKSSKKETAYSHTINDLSKQNAEHRV